MRQYIASALAITALTLPTGYAVAESTQSAFKESSQHIQLAKAGLSAEVAQQLLGKVYTGAMPDPDGGFNAGAIMLTGLQPDGTFKATLIHIIKKKRVKKYKVKGNFTIKNDTFSAAFSVPKKARGAFGNTIKFATKIGSKKLNGTSGGVKFDLARK